MAYYWKKKALLAKLETTYGVDPTPTGGANAILAIDVNLTPLEGDEVKREVERPYLGASPTILVNPRQKLSFSVELAGAGAAGTTPAYGVLLRACAFAEIISAGVKVDYQTISTTFESVTLYVNIDDVLHKLTGARGNVKLSLNASGLPKLDFEFIGKWAGPVAAALPTADFSAFQTPLPATTVNTPTFSFHGITPIVEEFEIDMGNVVDPRNLIGFNQIVLGDREATGKIKIEAPNVTTKDFFDIAQKKLTGSMQIVHGTAAGNIVELNAPKVEIGTPAYSESQNITMLDMNFVVLPDTGNDEILLTFK